MNESLKKKIGNYFINALIGFCVIFVYFFISEIEIPFLKLFNIDYNSMSTNIKIIYILIWELLTMAIIMLILNKKLSKDIIDMKKNHKKYFSKYFKYWLIAVGVMMVSNLIIGLISSENLPSNEETIRNLFKISPIFIFLSSVIYAPIVEELVFRQGIKNLIPNKIVFIITSGLIFGGLHIIGGYSGPFDLLYLIPYCSPGFAFAYMLADSDNVLISSGMHFMHNGILISLQFIILFFS